MNVGELLKILVNVPFHAPVKVVYGTQTPDGTHALTTLNVSVENIAGVLTIIPLADKTVNLKDLLVIAKTPQPESTNDSQS